MIKTMIMIMIVIMTMTMIMIMAMIMTMVMLMIMIMIMTMTMVSYLHHEAPRAVRGSVVGSSMDMWCPYGIGRESWDREVRRRWVCLASPPKGGSLPQLDKRVVAHETHRRRRRGCCCCCCCC